MQNAWIPLLQLPTVPPSLPTRLGQLQARRRRKTDRCRKRENAKQKFTRIWNVARTRGWILQRCIGKTQRPRSESTLSRVFRVCSGITEFLDLLLLSLSLLLLFLRSSMKARVATRAFLVPLSGYVPSSSLEVCVSACRMRLLLLLRTKIPSQPYPPPTSPTTHRNLSVSLDCTCTSSFLLFLATFPTAGCGIFSGWCRPAINFSQPYGERLYLSL